MFRSTSSILALLAAMTMPAVAADYADDWGDDGLQLRTSHTIEPRDWSELGDQTDPVAIEMGVRYWYSLGAQNFGIAGGSVTTQDQAHTGEVHLRIDDYSTNTYAKAWAGYSAAISGNYSTPTSSDTITGGQVGYAGADFGWNAVGDGNGSGAGFLVGYEYLNDSPRTDRDNYAIVESASDITYNEDTGAWSFGVDGVERHIDVHALRLGVGGRAKLGNAFDITAEVAAVPYANVSGKMGGFGGSIPSMPLAGCNVLPPGGCAPVGVITSPLSVSGWGYGAMGEVMAGFHPTENLTVRLGGRAWYLQGNYDATYTAAQITRPQRQPNVDDPNSDDPAVTIPPDPLYSAPVVSRDDYISTGNPFSMVRYGLLAELTYAF